MDIPWQISGNKLIERQTIPLISSKSALLEFYQVEYILSDVPLNYELYKKYDFDKYIIYLYKVLQSKKDKTISKINIFSNFDSYKKNIKKINNELFVLDSRKSIVKNIKKFCDVKTIINQSNKTIFDINTNNETCIAIFPTTFSHNNNFLFTLIKISFLFLYKNKTINRIKNKNRIIYRIEKYIKLLLNIQILN